MKYQGLLCFLVLCLLAGCTGDGTQMRQQLEALEQQNSSGEDLLNDSLAESLVSYFDRHGDANEQMRAKFILGCTYSNLNDLPRALTTYYEAADCADTMRTDCNYKVLSLIHAQCAMIYHTQVQPRSELQELRLAEHYAWKDKDTLQAIRRYSQQSGAYDFLKMPDSVLYVKEQAARMFREIGRHDRAARTLGGSTITSLLKKGEIPKALEYSRIYEQESGLFDADGSFDLKEGHNYIVRLTIKVPSDGQYMVNIGTWSDNDQLFTSVKARDDFQIIDVEYPEYKNSVSGCHVLLGCGWVVGTTILKEVEVLEKTSTAGVRSAKPAKDADDTIYNLSGQKVNASYKGIVIRKDRKIVK